MKEFQRERERLISYLLVLSPNGRNAWSWAGPVRSQELHPCLSWGVAGPRTWAICCCFPKDISRLLGQECSNRDLTQHPHEMLALQTKLFCTTSQCQIQLCLNIPCFISLGNICLQLSILMSLRCLSPSL